MNIQFVNKEQMKKIMKKKYSTVDRLIREIKTQKYNIGKVIYNLFTYKIEIDGLYQVIGKKKNIFIDVETIWKRYPRKFVQEVTDVITHEVIHYELDCHKLNDAEDHWAIEKMGY